MISVVLIILAVLGALTLPFLLFYLLANRATRRRYREGSVVYTISRGGEMGPWGGV